MKPSVGAVLVTLTDCNHKQATVCEEVLHYVT